MMDIADPVSTSPPLTETLNFIGALGAFLDKWYKVYVFSSPGYWSMSSTLEAPSIGSFRLSPLLSALGCMYMYNYESVK